MKDAVMRSQGEKGSWVFLAPTCSSDKLLVVWAWRLYFDKVLQEFMYFTGDLIYDSAIFKQKLFETYFFPVSICSIS